MLIFSFVWGGICLPKIFLTVLFMVGNCDPLAQNLDGQCLNKILVILAWLLISEEVYLVILTPV